MNPKIFPTILIVLDFAASVGYLADGDLRKFIYWIAAGVLTICVTY